MSISREEINSRMPRRLRDLWRSRGTLGELDIATIAIRDSILFLCQEVLSARSPGEDTEAKESLLGFAWAIREASSPELICSRCAKTIGMAPRDEVPLYHEHRTVGLDLMIEQVEKWYGAEYVDMAKRELAELREEKL